MRPVLAGSRIAGSRISTRARASRRPAFRPYGSRSRQSGVSTNLPNVQPSEDRYQYADSLSWTKGAHQFKFGVDIADLRDTENALFNGPGSYTYGSITAFAEDFSGVTDWEALEFLYRILRSADHACLGRELRFLCTGPMARDLASDGELWPALRVQHLHPAAAESRTIRRPAS